MKQDESKIKTHIKLQVQKAGGYARRIEDQFAVGVLDMIIILPGSPVFFAEVKLVKNCKFAPSMRQFVEMQRIEKVAPEQVAQHAHAVLVGWDPDIETYYVTGAREEVDTRKAIIPGQPYIAVGSNFIKTLREYYDAVR